MIHGPLDGWRYERDKRSGGLMARGLRVEATKITGLCGLTVSRTLRMVGPGSTADGQRRADRSQP
jgi:hypothetical protein